MPHEKILETAAKSFNLKRNSDGRTLEGRRTAKYYFTGAKRDLTVEEIILTDARYYSFITYTFFNLITEVTQRLISPFQGY